MYYGMDWNGKWLFTNSGELVSQKEITKRDLHPQLYGELNNEPDPNLQASMENPDVAPDMPDYMNDANVDDMNVIA